MANCSDCVNIWRGDYNNRLWPPAATLLATGSRTLYSDDTCPNHAPVSAQEARTERNELIPPRTIGHGQLLP
jgi:hypothetical protein